MQAGAALTEKKIFIEGDAGSKEIKNCRLCEKISKYDQVNCKCCGKLYCVNCIHACYFCKNSLVCNECAIKNEYEVCNLKIKCSSCTKLLIKYRSRCF